MQDACMPDTNDVSDADQGQQKIGRLKYPRHDVPLVSAGPTMDVRVLSFCASGRLTTVEAPVMVAAAASFLGGW